MTRLTSYVTRHTSHVTRHTSHSLSQRLASASARKDAAIAQEQLSQVTSALSLRCSLAAAELSADAAAAAAAAADAAAAHAALAEAKLEYESAIEEACFLAAQLDAERATSDALRREIEHLQRQQQEQEKEQVQQHQQQQQQLESAQRLITQLHNDMRAAEVAANATTKQAVSAAVESGRASMAKSFEQRMAAAIASAAATADAREQHVEALLATSNADVLRLRQELVQAQFDREVQQQEQADVIQQLTNQLLHRQQLHAEWQHHQTDQLRVAEISSINHKHMEFCHKLISIIQTRHSTQVVQLAFSTWVCKTSSSRTRAAAAASAAGVHAALRSNCCRFFFERLLTRFVLAKCLKAWALAAVRKSTDRLCQYRTVEGSRCYRQLRMKQVGMQNIEHIT